MARDLGPARPEEVGLSGDGLARIDAAIVKLIDGGELAGAVTLVARHGKIVHANAMGAKVQASRVQKGLRAPRSCPRDPLVERAAWQMMCQYPMP